LGKPKGITATAHTLARILYNLMRYGVEYTKQSEAAYAESDNMPARGRRPEPARRSSNKTGWLLPLRQPA
jgi:hypothetical protein